MANTGIKQAAVVYKVRAADGAPLDINGELTSISGRKQSIGILMGTSNPDPILYEVEIIFNAGDIIGGIPTIEYTDECPSGYLFVQPSRLIFQIGGASQNINILSSNNWVITMPNFATADKSSGTRGETIVNISALTIEGQGNAIVKSITGAQVPVYIIAVTDLNRWILESGFWNDLGFWRANGVWNY